MSKLTDTVELLHACSTETELREAYIAALVAHVGDAVALFAIREATCAKKESLEPGARTMTTAEVIKTIDKHYLEFSADMRSHALPLSEAHRMLKNDDLTLFALAGLAKALAVNQCAED